MSGTRSANRSSGLELRLTYELNAIGMVSQHLGDVCLRNARVPGARPGRWSAITDSEHNDEPRRHQELK